MKQIIFSLLTLSLLINCKGRNETTIKNAFQQDTVSIIENKDLINNDSLSEKSSLQESLQADTILRGDEIFEYSSYRFKTIAKRSEYEFLMLNEKNNTLSICCAWEEFSQLFGSPEKDKLLSRYDFLRLKEETYQPFDGEEEQVICKYYFHDSFIKTYYYPYKKENVIVCAKILDEEFVLRHNIHIGMDKQTFLGLLFNKSDINYLMNYDTINMGEDELGGLEYYYVFQSNNLQRIIIDTDFDWIDKELE